MGQALAGAERPAHVFPHTPALALSDVTQQHSAACAQDIARGLGPLASVVALDPHPFPPPPPLSRVGFLKAVRIPMFLPSRMSLALLPSQVSGGQGHLQVWQEGSMLLQRHDSRPGLWYQVPYRQRCLIEQGHQDEGPAPAKDTHQPQAGGTPT